MNIHLITIGQKMPDWVETGFAEYAKRLPDCCALNLIELPMPQRSKNQSVDQLKRKEAALIEKTIPKGALVIALDEYGQEVSTVGLSRKLEQWLEGGQDVALLVGGPDGLDGALLQKARWTWSLSKLTFPHPLVRIIVAEQLYRAWSVLNHHPYHRS
ncbi:23S rRNA (pseudouridine-1915-N(3)-) methyltransferase [Sulfurivirga caldicuralii]|uniref:Ribosomal RNA large subunit methyltransferase H n=1 Tax=Sulfurivirga caldicuralii TaxID=364032 RepID=A0A1N6DQ53_9GAMM|nr:23S rRNA (pseudouridine(1915)-N(3))-methyltransferase RlmH [Sulfurivirga caldicuralii]SIN72804.1 23S rRNA (pseudouridine-1915-N(3)-) methyltransferase [Sulfurivirga caldicuralii]